MSGSDAKMIKSAQRALEVLECFDPATPRATVMGLARRLGYPQSSTSELLGCLVNLGYLRYDRYRRTYEPTARVPLLGAWVQPSLFRCGRLLPMLDEIARATGETIALSTLVGLDILHVHVIPGANPGATRLTLGSVRSMLHSSAGRLFLSRSAEKRVRTLTHRINAEEGNLERRVKIEPLMNDLAKIRQQGYAAEFGDFVDDIAAITMLLPSSGGQMLAVGIVGQPDSLRANLNEYLAVVRAAVKQLARPRPVDDVYPPMLGRPAEPASRSYATA